MHWNLRSMSYQAFQVISDFFLTDGPHTPEVWKYLVIPNRPDAYDVTEGRPRVLGVKGGTVTCAIAKHAASGPTPACHTAELARARALTESQRSSSTARARSAWQVLTPNMASSLWRRDVNAYGLLIYQYYGYLWTVSCIRFHCIFDINTLRYQNLAHALAPHWDNTEATYIGASKHVFRTVRHEREDIYHYFYRIRRNFESYLRRPDSKQEYMNQWQQQYNEIAEDMRDDEETKAELHQRVQVRKLKTEKESYLEKLDYENDIICKILSVYIRQKIYTPVPVDGWNCNPTKLYGLYHGVTVPSSDWRYMYIFDLYPSSSNFKYLKQRRKRYCSFT